MNAPQIFLFPRVKKTFAGGIIHYSIGWLFVFIFDLIWKFTSLQPSLLSGGLLGFIFGFIGILGWTIMFYLNPDPPEIAFKKFYAKLIIAHVIFGIGASFVYVRN